MDNTNLINKEKFLCGIPTEIEGLCLVYPKTLREIALVGIKNFYIYLNFFTLNKEEIDNFNKENEIEEEITPFQFHLRNSIYDKNYQKNFADAFKFFLKINSITILKDNEAIVLDNDTNRVIKEKEFNLISEIIKAQNFLLEYEEENYSIKKPSNSKAKEILQKLEQRKKVIDKKKSHNNLDFYDLVGSLAIGDVGLNILNIWDITYYAFNDQFNRMKMKENYENDVKSLLAGADSKKIKLKHWIRKIQENEEK